MCAFQSGKPKERKTVRVENSDINFFSSSFFTGHLMWYHKLWPLTPLIIVAILVGCLIAVIILICIIICMCRRRRKRSSKSKNEVVRESHKNKSSRKITVPFYPPPPLSVALIAANSFTILCFLFSQAWKNHWWTISQTIPTQSHVKIMKIYRSMACKTRRPR